MKRRSILVFCILTILSLMFFTFSSCSSPKIGQDIIHSDLVPSYKVQEASSRVRPGWIEDPQVWAKENAQGVDKFRFFSYETEPKVSYDVACQLARASARVDIAAEISSEISKNLLETIKGDPRIDASSDQVKNLENFLDIGLEESIQAKIHGAQVIKVYWEKRKYLKDLGADNDYLGYTCAAYIKIDQNMLNSAINSAKDTLAKRAELKSLPEGGLTILNSSTELAKKELLEDNEELKEELKE